MAFSSLSTCDVQTSGAMTTDWRKSCREDERPEPVRPNLEGPSPISPPTVATTNARRDDVHYSSPAPLTSSIGRSVISSDSLENGKPNNRGAAKQENGHMWPTVPHKRPRLDNPSSIQFQRSNTSNSSWYPNAHPSQSAVMNQGMDHGYGGLKVSDRGPDTNSCGFPITISRAQELCNARLARGQETGHGSSQSAENAELGGCSTCHKVGHIAPQIYSGLEKLHGELSLLRAGQVAEATEDMLVRDRRPHPFPPRGLLDSLDWSLDKLNESVSIAKKMISSRSPHERDQRLAGSDEPLPTEEKSKRWEHDETPSLRSSHRSPPLSDEGTRQQELPPFLSEERKRSANSRESGPSLPGYSPIFSKSSGATQPTSPMQGAGPNRNYPTLPSPSSLTFSTSSNVLPPMSPSLLSGSTSRSAHTAHLQELQHQLSTKSLAHQILAGEHEKLLSAYSRLQTRCSALDKKSAVSDTEIANLVEDRLRLQAQLEVAEAQIDELQAHRAESSKQAAANGDQYLQIMNMSSQLQAKGASEQKRWKTDREAWLEEKVGFLERIAGLERKIGDVEMSIDGEEDLGPAAMPDDRSDSTDKLRGEIVRLRRRVREAEARLTSYADEAHAVERILAELGGVGQRLKKLTISGEGGAQ